MSAKVGIIAEGAVDYLLLPALVERIARDRATFTWPTSADDLGQIIPLRKRGHGGVLDTVRKLVSYLEDNPPTDHAFFVILLDRRTRPVHEEVRRLISGKSLFILATAIEEIEAWWLADRTNTLAWLDLAAPASTTLDYWSIRYKPERDPRPKRTLDELTRLSPRLDRYYGDGNTELATEFAQDYWHQHADLNAIERGCPQGFRRFCKDATKALRRQKARLGRLL